MEHNADEAGGGDSNAMYELGNLLLEQGDIDGAEEWYRRAAATGNIGAMHNLGIVLGEKGELTEAEAWYRRAAQDGHASSMSNLGSVLKNRGDLDGAEEWYRKSALMGNAYAMSNLGLLLAEKGDLDGAKVWYLRSADMGNTGAMHNLGYLLKGKGDLDGAEEWFRRSVEGGNTFTMINLGMVHQDRGDLHAAATWFQRAAELGIMSGESKLDELGVKKDSDRYLASVTFDTFGWAMTRNRDKFREWRTDNASLALRYFSRPPDLGSWNVELIREDLMTTLNLLATPTAHPEEHDLPEWFRTHMPRVLPEQVSLLELDCFERQSAKCVAAATRHRRSGDVRYAAGLFILFRECFWVIQLEVVESGDVGEREGAVAHHILERSASADAPIAAFDPYDRQWDGMAPIENDPLTRMRLLMARLQASLSFDPAVNLLEPFGGAAG